MDVEWDSTFYSNLYKSTASKRFNISGMTDDQFKKRLSLNSIFFRKLETTKITQSPSMTLTSLVANVGGLLGKSLYYFLKNQLHEFNLNKTFFKRTIFGLQSTVGNRDS